MRPCHGHMSHLNITTHATNPRNVCGRFLRSYLSRIRYRNYHREKLTQESQEEASKATRQGISQELKDFHKYARALPTKERGRTDIGNSSSFPMTLRRCGRLHHRLLRSPSFPQNHRDKNETGVPRNVPSSTTVSAFP